MKDTEDTISKMHGTSFNSIEEKDQLTTILRFQIRSSVESNQQIRVETHSCKFQSMLRKLQKCAQFLKSFSFYKEPTDHMHLDHH